MFYLVGLVCNGPEGSLVPAVGMQNSDALGMQPDRIAIPVSPDPPLHTQRQLSHRAQNLTRAYYAQTTSPAARM
jgi:hypothetical protein